MLTLPVTAFLGLVVCALLFLRPKSRYRLPPGPPGLPVIGNLLQLPGKLLHLRLDGWAKQYGPAYTFRVGSQPWLVLSSAKTSADVLDRRAGVTSDRPAWIKLNHFLCHNYNMITTGHNARWRQFRKAAHEALNIRACNAYCGMQEEEAALLVKGLAKNPEIDLIKHIARAASSIVWRALYGGAALILDGDDSSHRVEELFEYALQSTLPQNSVVDLVPVLQPVIAQYKFLRKHADSWFQEITGLYTELYAGARVAAIAGTPSLSSSFQAVSEELGITEVQGAWAVGVLFQAGQDTTAVTLRWFVQAMLLYPEVAAKAQSQLAEVVGDRPPTFADKPRLPYIEAIVKELLRWRPPATVGVPHYTSEDFEYDSFVIPKGTMLIDNIWTMSHDPGLYPEPDMFDPSRFLDRNGRLEAGKPNTHDDYLSFGHGRRICPGRDLAVNSLFIMVAYLSWALDFKKARDDAGNEITPDPDDLVDLGLTVHPKPFKVKVIPRFADLQERLG